MLPLPYRKIQSYCDEKVRKDMAVNTTAMMVETYFDGVAGLGNFCAAAWEEPELCANFSI